MVKPVIGDITRLADRAVDHFTVGGTLTRGSTEYDVDAVVDVDVEHLDSRGQNTVLIHVDTVTFRNFDAERGDVFEDVNGNQWELTQRLPESDRDIDRWAAKKVSP